MFQLIYDPCSPFWCILAAMLQIPCPETVENLWRSAETLFYDLGTALAEINEMWAEISSMYGVVSPENNFPPKTIADYLIGGVQQLQYIQQATELLPILRDINQRNKKKRLMAKVNELKEALAKVDQEYAAKVFEPETAAAFLNFNKIIMDYPCDLKRLQATAIIVAYTPMFYIRDTFASYLGLQRPSAEVFKLLLEIAADTAIDFLGPVVAIAKRIAEAGHEHSEGRYERFTAGLEHEVLQYRLKTAVEEGFGALREAEKNIAELKVQEEALDQRFDHAANKCMEVMAFLSKGRKAELAPFAS